jgi:DNA repair protein RadC
MDIEILTRTLRSSMAPDVQHPRRGGGVAEPTVQDPSEEEVNSGVDSCDEESFFDGDAWVGYRTYVKLVRENSGCRRPYAVKAPSDVYRVFATLSECDRERLYTVHLDGQNQVCGVELISQGTVGSSLATPREVYKSAILANASGIILVHNHPSGVPSPSVDDRSLTTMLKDSGRVLDIPVYDHVIIGEGTYFSFAEAGLL